MGAEASELLHLVRQTLGPRRPLRPPLGNIGGLLLFGLVLCAGCGYVGDPLPPALNIAAQVRDLRVVEYGDRLIIDFTIPALTTEGLVVKRLGTVDLRIGPGTNPFDVNQWAAAARKVPVNATATGPASTSVPITDWTGKEVVVGVRVINLKGRASAWSNVIAISVVPALPPPSNIRPESAPQGARIVWQSPEHSFRVFRRGPNEKQPALLGNTGTPDFLDATAQFGTAYEYRVQAVRDKAESLISEAVSLTPADTFPPTAPAGLSAVPGIGTIELVWDRNTEPDLRGYRIYRAAESGQFERISESTDTPAYSDRQIEAGKKYRYAISAIDQSGNESPRSASVEATAP
jgi:hypothetical protein